MSDCDVEAWLEELSVMADCDTSRSLWEKNDEVGLSPLSNFYSPLNGRITYINTKNNTMAIREAKNNMTYIT